MPETITGEGNRLTEGRLTFSQSKGDWHEKHFEVDQRYEATDKVSPRIVVSVACSQADDFKQAAAQAEALPASTGPHKTGRMSFSLEGCRARRVGDERTRRQA